ncbi:hypothetical protein HOY80DRAFT_1137646 [Tuber brumale]|nr:hypothetical protein HOY80DRAFT_1137646 [Tuber brumale]
MIFNSNATRAEVFTAIVKYQLELLSLECNQTSKTAELCLLLHRLLVVFHPNSLPPLPRADRVLSYYPTNPGSSRGWKTMRPFTKNLDDDRVSRVITRNKAQINRLRKAFSEMMKEVLEEEDPARQEALVGRMEKLGVSWAASEARIQAVKNRFENRRGGVCDLRMTL